MPISDMRRLECYNILCTSKPLIKSNITDIEFIRLDGRHFMSLKCKLNESFY